MSERNNFFLAQGTLIFLTNALEELTDVYSAAIFFTLLLLGLARLVADKIFLSRL